MKSFSFFVTALAVVLFSSCGTEEAPKKEVEEVVIEEETPEVKAEEVVEEVAEVVEEAVADEPEEVAALRSQFPEGGFEWKVLDFIASEQPEIVVVLDKVPLEGEELSVEAEGQLDNLVAIHTAFPFLMIDVQAHTTEASNGVGRQAKRASSKARAVWVSTKLNFKGIPSDKLSSSGMADEQLLSEYSGDDKRQKRIMAKITKP